jgi:NAD+ diphosphatase
MRGQSLCVLRGAAGPELPSGALPPGEGWLYLGQLGEDACYARELGPDEAPPAGTELQGMRGLYGALGEEDFGVAGRAIALLEWDLAHRFCGRCGQPTTRSEKERSRLCAPCKASHYPRLSPAIICLVERDGQALLARNRNFPRPFFSCLAGFVEVGETLEETVAREVTEEVGIRIKDVRYFGSQAWPFTHSLMIGFHARYESGEVRPDEEEISEARWFSPEAMPELPPPISISRALIDDFLRRQRG